MASNGFKAHKTQEGEEYLKQKKEIKVLVNSLLTEEQKQYCVKLGGGNLSSGIRLCILDHIKAKQK